MLQLLLKLMDLLNSVKMNVVIVRVIIRDEQSEAKEYAIPLGKHFRVHEGDRVKAGDRLSEGSIDPHDILRIMGENAVQQYMLDEIQAVYRLAGCYYQ